MNALSVALNAIACGGNLGYYVAEGSAPNLAVAAVCFVLLLLSMERAGEHG